MNRLLQQKWVGREKKTRTDDGRRDSGHWGVIGTRRERNPKKTSFKRSSKKPCPNTRERKIKKAIQDGKTIMTNVDVDYEKFTCYKYDINT